MPAVKPYHRVPSRRKKLERTPEGFRKYIPFALGMGGLSFLIWAYFHMGTVIDETTQKVCCLLAQGGFKLEDVVVEGRKRTDKKQILEALRLERDQPLFMISVNEAKDKLEKLPWIKAVSVERRLPSSLIIRLSEKEPIAIWQNQGKTYLVDRDGSFVETRDVQKYKSLLYVTGQKAPSELGKLVEVLEKFPDVCGRITSATHLRHARWDLRLDGIIDVKLPEKNPEEALFAFLQFEKQHGLSQQGIQTIDMRLPDRWILRLKKDAALKKRTNGKDI